MKKTQKAKPATTNQVSSKRGELLAIAQGLAIADCDVMSTKALKRAIKEAQAPQATEPLAPAATVVDPPAAEPLPTPPEGQAPAAESPPKKKPPKEPRKPLTSAQVEARVSAGLATIGQVEGAPAAGGAWESPAHRGHIVIGSYERDGYIYVRTVRTSDGREFTARTKRIVRDIAKQAGYASEAIAPAAVG